VKGQRYLLSAANKLFRMYDNLYLLLVGRIGRKEKVFELVEPEFHDRIVLPGLRRDIPLLLSIMDIFVFPSTVEAFGNSMIEAMSMAKPVLVSDIPSFREFIENKTNGIFFGSSDIESLLNAIINLIENTEQWQALGDNARKTVIEKFTPDRMFNETEDIYLDLMKGSS
jgi:glycosyltransferase involved in cell wall biosynthesis